MAKYDPLRHYLAGQNGKRIVLSFEQIEEVIGAALAPYARKRDPRWWANEGEDGRHVQAHAWRKAGYKVDRIDFDNELVTFVPI